MATIVAHQEFDTRGINLYLLDYLDLEFTLANGQASPEGTVYPNAVKLSYTDDGVAYFTFFGGTGFTYGLVDGETGITGGTLQGIFQTVESGPNAGADFSIEGLSLSAADVYLAFRSDTTADDLALITQGLSGNDTITLLAASADYAYGYAGNDTISGGGGNDTLLGGTGNDRLVGEAGIDSLVGGAGSDTYVATAGDKIVETKGAAQGTADLVLSAGTWVLGANIERLTLTGAAIVNGTGNALANVITGNGAKNVLNSGAGNDVLNGGNGNDALNGSTGNDQLNGQSGNDTLYGGAGNDGLNGGGGADRFVFNSALGAGNVDTIKDALAIGQDRIVLDDDVFTAFAGRQDALGDVGTILSYNASTGALLYDADGAGAGAAVQFATIGATTHQALTAQNIVDLVLIVA